jgi:hypothetical protein
VWAYLISLMLVRVGPDTSECELRNVRAQRTFYTAAKAAHRTCITQDATWSSDSNMEQ